MNLGDDGDEDAEELEVDDEVEQAEVHEPAFR